MSKQTYLISKPVSGIILIIMTILALSACATTSRPREVVVADIDPIQVGTFSVGIVRPFTFTMKVLEIPVTFDPRSGYVHFQFSYDISTYRLYWDAPNRQAFIVALDQYKEDYQAHNLNLSRSRARRAYGTINGFADWGTLKSMLNLRGYPKVELGYAFRDNNPYFIINQRETKDISQNSSGERRSINLTLYFTRAMAEDLARLLDPDHLLNLIPPEYRPAPREDPLIEDKTPPRDLPVPVDEY
jgi:hypothetical protein